FAATADEEMGEGEAFGAEWLCEAHPEALRAEYAINEGGGDRIVLGNRVLYLCSAAEKASSPFLLRVHGRSGHASMPGIADNALLKAARLLDRLDGLRPDPVLVPEVEALLRTVTGRSAAPADALELARSFSPLAASLVEPLLSLTVSPTMIHASRKRNVVPALCEVTVD